MVTTAIRVGIVAIAVVLTGCRTAPPEAAERPAERDVDADGVTRLFDGRDLDGWRIVDEYVFEEHGEVAVVDGTVVLGEGDSMTGISWARDFPKTDYEVSLEAMRTSGSDFFCGMTFPVGNSWLTLIVGGWGGMVVGLSNIDGMNASENQTTQGISFESNRWYPIRLRVTRQTIGVWINEKQVIEQQRFGHKFDIWWEQEPVRPFGIATWYTGARLRNVTLRRL